jgi:hypothetical protein
MTVRPARFFFSVAATSAFSLLTSSSLVTAQEIYTATVIVPEALGPDRKAELTLTINDFASDEEAAELQALLQNEGSDALFAELRKRDEGLAMIKGSASQRILYARLIPGEGGNRISIITAAQLYMPDRSQDPLLENALGFVQLDVNTRGMGSGLAAAIEEVRVTEEGVLQMVTQRTQPIRLENVSRKD